MSTEHSYWVGWGLEITLKPDDAMTLAGFEARIHQVRDNWAWLHANGVVIAASGSEPTVQDISYYLIVDDTFVSKDDESTPGAARHLHVEGAAVDSIANYMRTLAKAMIRFVDYTELSFDDTGPRWFFGHHIH